MSLKNAACLALTGASLLTFVLSVHLVMDGWGLLNGVLPVIGLLASLVRACAGLSAAVFLYVFYKKAA
jgi:hypothetical protein